MPHYEFNEVHQRRIDASVEVTWNALAALTLDDLTITRPLVVLRHLARKRTPRSPLLTEGAVTLLHREDGQVALAGAIGRPWRLNAQKRPITNLPDFLAFTEPGWTKYLTEFRVDPGARTGHCLLSTETRGFSTDQHARKRFRLYWTVIRIPSGLIRRDILRTVARMAARSGEPVSGGSARSRFTCR